MRRDPDSPNGVMDALMVALIERFRAEGLSGMTLGLAPMVNIAGNRVRERAMRLDLRAWRSTVQLPRPAPASRTSGGPQWQPRYLAFTSDAVLPKVALAIARAGELPDPTAWLTRLRRSVDGCRRRCA